MSEDALTVAAQIPSALRLAVADKLALAVQEQVAERLRRAIGDLNTLRELGLPAERVRVRGRDPAGALRALTATIKEAL